MQRILLSLLYFNEYILDCHHRNNRNIISYIHFFLVYTVVLIILEIYVDVLVIKVQCQGFASHLHVLKP